VNPLDSLQQTLCEWLIPLSWAYENPLRPIAARGPFGVRFKAG
jgi:hypothetical protein